MRKLYNQKNELICPFCGHETAISNDMPYCLTCNAKCSGMMQAAAALEKIIKEIADGAFAFDQKAMKEQSMQMQHAMLIISQVRKSIESHPLLKLDKMQRGYSIDI